MLDLKSLIPWRQKTNVPVNTEHSVADPFMTFKRDMDRLFDSYMDGFGGFGTLARAGNDNSAWSAITPVVDVEYNDKAVIITAEIPGVDASDLDVSLSGEMLTIHGEKKHEREETDNDRHYSERRYGSFSRAIRLPFEVGDQDVDASFDNGVLTVSVPKPADWQDRTTRIDIKVG